MKKLFIILAVSSVGFMACNNDTNSNTTTDTVSTEMVDTQAITPADTMVNLDTNSIATPDTTIR